MTTGRCLCGGVAFELHGPLRPVSLCHCSICRRWNGHAGACPASKGDHCHITDGLPMKPEG